MTHPSLVDVVVDGVFHRIVEGRLAAGQRITEGQIASEMGVSRTPVREALKRLSEMGLVVIKPRVGLEVASVDQRDVEQIVALRCELEALALRLAMPRIEGAALAKLEALAARVEEMLDRGNRLAVFKEDRCFHLALAELSGNRYVQEALWRLDPKVQLCRMYLCLTDDVIRRPVLSHRKILEAMQRREAAAAESLLREHISGALL